MSPKPKLVSDNTVSPSPAPTAEKQTAAPKGGPAYRIRTVRGYRRMVDWATRRMIQGLLSKEDLLAITTAARTGAELMMTENILAGVGQDRELDNILGDDGGFKRPRKPRGFVKRKVVIKSGVGKDGASIDELTETQEGDLRDDVLPKEIMGIPV